jgi:phospholipid/cholesterol/gamma-HCH transport system permease protein
MAGASFTVTGPGTGQDRVVALAGDWTVWTIPAVEAELVSLAQTLGPRLRIDASQLGKVDVAGAYVIARMIGGADGGASVLGGHDGLTRLIRAVQMAAHTSPAAARKGYGVTALMERVGRGAVSAWRDGLDILSFFGETLATIFRVLINPRRLRLTSVTALLEQAGLNALPIVAILSFFVGLVIAYLGASVLEDFGAQVFTVELVGFSVLREFAVVITAVLLAGRTDSAFTAEIGAMRMRQEIDAMRVLGLDVMERLVAPRVIAMVIATPLLTFAAMIAGLFGGALVCWAVLGVSPVLFLSRIQDGVGAQHFWVGMVKAPVFGLVLAVVGCRHGLKVGGDVASLGRETTSSVVQAIFLVIVIDAMFALWFRAMNW